MRYWLAISLLVAVGCSKGKTTEELIAEDVKARGLDKPPPQAAPAPEAAEFKPYNSPDRLFRVNFPGEPRVADAGASEPDHRTGMQSYVVLREPRQYSILCSRFDEAREPAKEFQEILDRQIRQTLEGKVVDSKDVTLKGKPGKEVVIVDDERARRLKVIVDGKDVYQVSVDVPKGEVDGVAAKGFVDSFELLKE